MIRFTNVVSQSLPLVYSRNSHKSGAVKRFFRALSSTTNPSFRYSTFEANESYRTGVNRLFREISEDETYIVTAQTRWIDRPNWLQYVNTVRRRLVKDPLEILVTETAFEKFCKDLRIIEDALSQTRLDDAETTMDYLKDDMFGIILTKAEEELSDLIVAFKALRHTSDLTVPHNWYPVTRIMKRKFIYHGGPTNSGKTYHALQRLRQADPEKGGGLYCGPLRLLALEVYDSLNRQGVYTSLITGQERREVPGATHVSSTLEMVNLNNEYDIVVMDEIQMIADKERGYAWTRALLGLKAREIHICGGLEAELIVRSLVETSGDEFTIQKYDRLSSLQIEDEALRGDYSKLQPGDCVVAFSKADIFSIRREIEKHTSYSCAVIYGQLPPETRSTQARLFNEDGSSGFDILVASDAIGMGLNLNIRRIIFHTTLKKDKTGVYWVEPSNIKQIAGRAGRLSSQYKVGLVTAWQEVDLAYVRSVMAWDIPQINSAGIFPSVEQIELFAGQLRQMNSAEAEAQKKEEEEEEFADDTANDEHDGNGTHKDYITVNVRRDESSTTSVEDANLETMVELDNILKYSIMDHAPSNTETTNTNASTSTGANTATGAANEMHENISGDGSSIQATGSVVVSPMSEESIRLSSIMDKYVKLSQMDGRFHLCDHHSMLVVSNWLHSIPLSIPDRFIFANAPVNIRDSFSMNVLYDYAAKFALQRPVALNIRLSRSIPSDLDGFTDLCVRHNILDLYLWLSNRYPKYFIEHDLCLEQKSFAIQQIEATLVSSPLQREYSHSENYMRLRSKQGIRPPPENYGQVRTGFLENIKYIPEAMHYIVDKKTLAAIERKKQQARERKRMRRTQHHHHHHHHHHQQHHHQQHHHQQQRQHHQQSGY